LTRTANSASGETMGLKKPTHADLDANATEIWRIRSDVAHADVFSVGAALHNLKFQLPNGSSVFPLAEAHWQQRYLTQSGSGHPRHMELLGGEWPCVPFGSTGLDPSHHGFGADNPWRVVRRGDNHIALAIDYPEGHAIARLDREIRLPMGHHRVDITLGITSNRDVVVPVGVHPVLNIPKSRDWSLAPSRFERGTTSRKASRVGGVRMMAGNEFDAFGQVDLISGGTANLWHNPNEFTDALIQLWSTDGTIELHDHIGGVATRICWDPTDLPHCLLWFANPGLSIDGETAGFRGLGVEPIHSCFDGHEQSTSVPSGVTLTAGQTWHTSYRISCHALSPRQDESESQ
jgi:galactose mutarotase-like enzyme